ncbi:MAG: hypothetical protein AAGH78_00910 [Cyanobacteria bacterium P01_H01_bin.58]
MRKSSEPLKIYSFRLSARDIRKIDSQHGESRTARLRTLLSADTTPEEEEASKQNTPV